LEKTFSADKVPVVEDQTVAASVIDPQSVVVCIPAYNMEAQIAKVIIGAQRFLYPVIVCDDGSNDSTGDIAEALRVFVITHRHSKGVGESLKSLFMNARKLGATYIVTMNGDGQNDPSDIRLLLDRLRMGDVDVVLGSRFMNVGSPKKSLQGSKLVNVPRLTDPYSGFMAFSSKGLDLLNLNEGGVLFTSELLVNAFNAGLKVAEVQIHVAPDVEAQAQNMKGGSSDGILSTLKSVSINHPLLLFGVPGVLALIFSLAAWGFALMLYLQEKYVSTNAIIVGAGTLSAGLILIVAAVVLWIQSPKNKRTQR
jgi:hypothetical protein